MCIFCDIAKHTLDTNIVYEDNVVIAFLDSNPINEGHILIVPKEHYLDIDEIPENINSYIISIAKKIVTTLKSIYHPDGYTIMQNGGIFNDIGHSIYIFFQDIQMMTLIGQIMKRKLNIQKWLLIKLR